jgi:hypothetical protein
VVFVFIVVHFVIPVCFFQLPVVLLSSDAGAGRFDKYAGPHTRAGLVQQLNKVKEWRALQLQACL